MTGNTMATDDAALFGEALPGEPPSISTALSSRGRALVILAAAGTGSRMGGIGNKQFLNLAGQPLILRTVSVFDAMSEIEAIVLVCSIDDLDQMKALVAASGIGAKVAAIVPGGATRQESVRMGLEAALQIGLSQPDNRPTLVHDGARCLVTPTVIRNVLAGIARYGACGAAVAMKDTIQEADSASLADGRARVLRTLPRDRLFAMQTPQGASFGDLLAAHRAAAAASFQATDDLAVLRHHGLAVHLCEGDYANLKITTPEDLISAEALLR